MPHMTLMDSSTGHPVELGAMVRPVNGGRLWRLEQIILHRGEHHVRCSQTHPRMGRVTRVFHPSALGLTVSVAVEFYRDRSWYLGKVREMAVQAVLLTVGGVIAWLLAGYGDAHWHWLLTMAGAVSK